MITTMEQIEAHLGKIVEFDWVTREPATKDNLNPGWLHDSQMSKWYPNWHSGLRYRGVINRALRQPKFSLTNYEYYAGNCVMVFDDGSTAEITGINFVMNEQLELMNMVVIE